MDHWGDIVWEAIGLAMIPLVLAAWVRIAEVRGWFGTGILAGSSGITVSGTHEWKEDEA